MFDNLIGNEKIKEDLSKILKENNIETLQLKR